MQVREVLNDLVAEQDELDQILADVDEASWSLPTPSPGWTVADQIAHLTYFDATAALAIRDPDGFISHRAELVSAMADPEAVDRLVMGPLRTLTVDGLRTEWRLNRAALAADGSTLGDDTRVEWYGPSMGARSFLTARLMEAWAHGQDILDALGLDRTPTDRLKHIAQLGVITRGWSYINRGLPVPDGQVSVSLMAPSGAIWDWSKDGAEASISGPALDFCLVVTQRRHVDDTRLDVTGHLAREWMVAAQAFAGGATDGPAAGSFPLKEN
jgi:uncharacterized protein (TIGR03084 family)